jgi:YVTN family beta-propeller protein
MKQIVCSVLVLWLVCAGVGSSQADELSYSGVVMTPEFSLTDVSFLDVSSITLVGAMPAPEGKSVFTYQPALFPIVHADPSQARPIGVGSVASNGDVLNIQVALARLSEPVDIYFALYAPAVYEDDWLVLTPSGVFRRLTEVGLVPWMEDTVGPATRSLFSDINTAFLPQGTYELFLAVTPAGDPFSRYYIWQTSFSNLRYHFPGILAALDLYPALFIEGFTLHPLIQPSIDFSFLMPAEPDHVVLMNNGENGKIDILNGETGAYYASLTTGARNPEILAMDPAGKYVFTAGTDTWGTELHVFDMESRQGSRLEFGTWNTVEYGSMCVSPQGTKLGVTSYWNYHCYLDVWDVQTRSRVAWVDQNGNWGGGREYCPWDCAFSPDGSRLFVTGGLHDNLVVFDAVTFQELAKVPVGRTAGDIAVSPDGTRLFITAWSEHAVSVMDTAGMQVVRVIDGVGLYPEALAVSPDGTELWVQSYFSNLINVIDTATFEQKTFLVFGPGPGGWPSVGDVTHLVFTPDGDRVYCASYNYLHIIDARTYQFLENRSVSRDSHALAAGLYVGPAPEAPATLHSLSGAKPDSRNDE